MPLVITTLVILPSYALKLEALLTYSNCNCEGQFV